MTELSRLRWRCRRGMKELDIAMTAYLDNVYQHATADQQADFLRLLDMPDPDLFALLMGRLSADNPTQEKLVNIIRSGGINHAGPSKSADHSHR